MIVKGKKCKIQAISRVQMGITIPAPGIMSSCTIKTQAEVGGEIP